MQGPFGTLSEVIGVPRMAAGSRTPRRMAGSRRFTTGLNILLAGVLIASAAVTVVYLF